MNSVSADSVAGIEGKLCKETPDGDWVLVISQAPNMTWGVGTQTHA